MKKILIEEDVSEDDLRLFILKQTLQHQAIKKAYVRIGKFIRWFGFAGIFTGIPELVNASGVILFWAPEGKFYLIAHLSLAGLFLLVGIPLYLYGNHKKKFMESKEKKISSKVYAYYRDIKRL